MMQLSFHNRLVIGNSRIVVMIFYDTTVQEFSTRCHCSSLLAVEKNDANKKSSERKSWSRAHDRAQAHGRGIIGNLCFKICYRHSEDEDF